MNTNDRIELEGKQDAQWLEIESNDHPCLHCEQKICDDCEEVTT